MMLVTLDNLAHRYKILPSEALERASSFDLYVLNVSTQWHNYKQEQASAQQQGKPGPVKLTQNELKLMLDAVRNKEQK